MDAANPRVERSGAAGSRANLPADGTASGSFAAASPAVNVTAYTGITALVAGRSDTDGISTYSSGTVAIARRVARLEGKG